MISKIRQINISTMKQLITSRNIAILLFVLYYFVGVFIFGDYGISSDEQIERTSSLTNYTYVMERLMASSDSYTVRMTLENAPELSTWGDRFYGVALQSLTVVVEHIRNFEMTYREIFLMRHMFTFINYFLGCIFFYLILRRRFGNSFIPVVGILFYILYPRFFGESFFNIKDILFYSWCIIASYFVLRWLEDDRKEKFIFPAAVTLAVAANTRILGISILLLACGIAFLQGILKGDIRHNIKKCCHLALLTFASYVVITPFTWANPLKNTIDTFFHFLRFQPWWGNHFYMGEMITRDVPWHYIPVWMGLTVPLLYIVMFFVGIAAIVFIWAKTGGGHLYDLFFSAMFACTLLGFIILRISMYEGWRHAYSIFLPFLYVAVYGVHRSYKFFNRRGKVPRYGFIGVVAASLVYLLVWITANHPYQYVYFNHVGRRVAERNFTLDYWYVSSPDLIRYALSQTDEPLVTIAVTNHSLLILTEEERARIVLASDCMADFYIRGSRMDYNWRMRPVSLDLQEIAAIEVDGMRIATLFQRVFPFTVDVDLSAWDMVVGFESNVDNNFYPLRDGNPHTRWVTGRPQQPGDYMLLEFSEAVDFNYIHMSPGHSFHDFPRDLAISTSVDGVVWQPATIELSSAQSHFIFETEAYRFLRLEVRGWSEHNWWSVFDMSFGHVR